jgi:glucans biosynthesis protein C
VTQAMPVGTGSDRLGRDIAADRAKVALTCAVIVTHCAIVYGADGDWFYREVAPGGPVQALDLLFAFGELFAMGSFFFLAGCFLPRTLARKGARRFAADRAARLGLPVLIYLVVIVPSVEWLVARFAGPGQSAGVIWTRQLRQLDPGPLWFAAVLLLVSAVAAFAYRPVRPARSPSLALLSGYAAGIAAVSFLVRLRFSVDTFQVGSAHVWQWGQCLGMFVLGVCLGRAGLRPVDRRTRQVCQWTLLTCLIALASLLLTYRDDLDPLGGGPHWPAAMVAVLEGAAAVSAPVVLLHLLRPRQCSGGSHAGQFASAAFVAYLAQVPVIVLAALVLRHVPLPAPIKFLFVTTISLTCCLGIGLAAARRWPNRVTIVHTPPQRVDMRW